VLFREATAQDISALVDVQQDGAVRGLSHIFPQERFPFPRAAIVQRWFDEIADPATAAYVSTDDAGAVTGFAATRGSELLHFGTSPSTWGSGLAGELHDAVLRTLAKTAPSDVTRIRLRVFEANTRARRFYERRGWVTTGLRSRTSFPPHPELVEYARVLTADSSREADSALTE
jgi:RimJ/RimL family protein N-acetyltransferase